MLNLTRQIRGSPSHVTMLTASRRFRLPGKRGPCAEAASAAGVVGMQFYAVKVDDLSQSTVPSG
jgi:hypothetical protein